MPHNPFGGFHRQCDWQNQRVTAINREPAHFPWGAYQSRAAALKREQSPFRMSLDGAWRFCLYQNADALPEGFYLPDFSDGRDGRITVPGNWEQQGFAKPVYTNSLYPFSPDAQGAPYLIKTRRGGGRIFEDYEPPYVDEKNNHVGVYRRAFVLPDSFGQREVFLRLNGVESAAYIWVNGQPVGYTQDSKLPAEFVVTPYLHNGQNTVVIAVLRFCDGTWLEDQDYFHVSGIFRSAELISKPFARIADITADARPDDCGGGAATATVFVNRVEYYADYTARMSLYGPDGGLIAEQTAGFDSYSPITGKWKGGPAQPRKIPRGARFNIVLPSVTPWSWDSPSLYTAVFTLSDPDGNEVDYESARLGFRRVEIKNNVILLNGSRIVFRGVNRHEWAWPTGRAVSREHMVKELKRMKELNFNAVRTCHYPDDPIWYDLCDEYGMLVVCEANLETHGVAGRLTNDPEWAEPMLERARRMAATHKNHPCIVSWSLGNESGYGPNHAAMANWLREYDGTRLVQYENCDPGPVASDIKCTMYPNIEAIMRMIADNDDRRPIVMVEYAYQISNATGGFDQFWRLAEAYPIFQGGFVWDWQDKCLPAITGDGRTYYGYGGDFGEDIVDWVCPEYMTANGVVLPDLTPKPCAWEIKQGQAPVIIRADDINCGRFTVLNRYSALSLEYIRCRATIISDGIETACFDVALPAVPPNCEASFAIDPGLYGVMTGEAYLNLAIITARDTPLVRSGHEVALYQFKLRDKPMAAPAAPCKGQVAVNESNGALTVSGAGFAIAFDMERCLIESYELSGARLLYGGAENVSRARSGMHLEAKWGGPVQAAWDKLIPGSLERKKAYAGHGTIDGSALVRFVTLLCGPGGDIRTETVYTIAPDGSVDVNVTMDIPGGYEHVPRVGICFTAPGGVNRLRWYGRGPGESYCDRTLAAPFGVYESSTEETHFPFVPPSHNGSHCDTSWLELSDGHGRVLRVTGDRFCFDAHHNTAEEYWRARHEHELIRHDETFLCLDGRHAGIGGNMAWSTSIDERHLVPSGRHQFRFMITASNTGEG